MEITCVKDTKLGTVVRFMLTTDDTGIGDFFAKKNEIAVRYGEGQTIIYCGLGEPAALTVHVLRSAGAAALRKAVELKRSELAFFEPPLAAGLEPSSALVALVEGALLASYSFAKHKSEKPAQLTALEIVTSAIGPKELEGCLAICAGVFTARDLVNDNASEISPAGLADRAKSLCRKYSALKCKILDEKALAREKLGLLLAVGRGSHTPPRLIIIEYKGDPKSAKKTAVIGKGLTFDSGGYNLKPSGSIEAMRDDMAGGAAVLGLMQALAGLKAKVNVIGIVPAAHNALQGNAYFPGDVYRSYSGKTVEILNTDAEGRLILADAISYCQKNHKPSQIIDLATLTGAILYALGEFMSGLFCNDEEMAAALLRSSERTNEKAWRMPLIEALGESLKSDFADLRNTAKLPRGHAGSSVGAAFLQAFIEKDMPWAHLDIAGVAYVDRDDKNEVPKYATGYGVRLLVDYLLRA